ncbi:cytochrome c maturation protein CcmE domain-containing protein [Neolewinella antarctica]|uniref:Cytochrome c-type biogenesis protein CcmE n=1 Tax=Neolewinella antarctica TaxID=442734 RepID=A0ABX0X7C7_9BACT|nr:cytochrome c maturation protein CcmE [Neolewinella antarctica]NJC25149.1 cytochrome c-type biogenesis protein CcmE [Neolewinella antarctica]
MKKSYILALLMVIGAVCLVYFSSDQEVARYRSFAEASTTGTSVKLVGTLVKDKPMDYNPLENPDLFSFYLKDEQGTERRVNLTQAKPQDFEMSESIVLSGKMVGEEFLATDIQMKCPSKYKDEESMIKELTES